MRNPLSPLYPMRRAGTGGVHVSALGSDEPAVAPDGSYVPPLEGAPYYGVQIFPDAVDTIQYLGVMPVGMWLGDTALIAHGTEGSATLRLELIESSVGAGDGHAIATVAAPTAAGPLATAELFVPTAQRHILAATWSAAPADIVPFTLQIGVQVPPRY